MTRIFYFNFIFAFIDFSLACPRTPAPAPVTRCQAIPNPTDGRVDYSSAGREAGTSLTYVCNSGFYVQGPKTRSCQSSAQWSLSDSLCSPITCTNLAAPPNSNVVYQDSNGHTTEYGKNATVTCNSGYILVGTNPVICRGSDLPGTWSDSFPTCVRQCPSLTAPSNGNVTYSSQHKEEGSTLRVACDAGYYIQGAPERTCQSGAWTGSAATCQQIECTRFSTFQNGAVSYNSMSGSNIPYGATATFSCTSPYSLKGSATITCQGMTNPGTWSNVTPFCSQGVSCPNPGTLQNGQIMGNNQYFDGATLTFMCNANYEMNGMSSMSCSSSGTWSASLPTCTEKRYDCSTSEPCNPEVIKGKSLYRHTMPNKYVQCDNGNCYQQSCPGNLVFDGNNCDYPPTG